MDCWPHPLAQAKRNRGGKGKEEKQKTESSISQGNRVPGEEKPELLPAEQGIVLSFTHPEYILPNLHPFPALALSVN